MSQIYDSKNGRRPAAVLNVVKNRNVNQTRIGDYSIRTIFEAHISSKKKPTETGLNIKHDIEYRTLIMFAAIRHSFKNAVSELGKRNPPM